jgi:arginine decarboxylase
MDVPDDMPDRPLLFAVQSTHKMLAAFSMASMIHVKLSDRAPLDFDQFNESFMMHGTTSPFYPMIASLDVATSMMDEPAGPTLMYETIQDAISFRKAMSSIAHRLRSANGEEWFFRIYQPDTVTDPVTGETSLFEETADSLLTQSQACWTLTPGKTGMASRIRTLPKTTACSTPPRSLFSCPASTRVENLRIGASRRRSSPSFSMQGWWRLPGPATTRP